MWSPMSLWDRAGQVPSTTKNDDSHTATRLLRAELCF